MNTHAVERIEENREDLEDLAASDLPCAEIADALLEIANDSVGESGGGGG